MKRMIKKAALLFLAVSMFFLNGNTLAAKGKTLSGQDANGNTWKYERKNRTLTFSGTKDLKYFELDGHSPEPEWWCWSEEAEHLVIENGITGLPGEEFMDFYKLKTIKLPDTVTYIGEGVFQNCWSLETVIMSDNITLIGNYAFSACRNLPEICIPKKVVTIGRCVFGGCWNLKKIEIPDKVTKIGVYAFAECKNLEYIYLPDKLKTIEEGLFRNCKRLQKVKIPVSVKKIDSAAFMGAGITSVEIPENVTNFYIEKNTYSRYGIFQDCKKLKVITIKSKNLNHIYKGAFLGLNKNTVIKVPKSCLKKYKKLFKKAGLDKKVKVKAISGKKKFKIQSGMNY